MTATIGNRKRSREDDGNDPMPLSKRINNLHINNNSNSFHQHNQLEHQNNHNHQSQQHHLFEHQQQQQNDYQNHQEQRILQQHHLQNNSNLNLNHHNQQRSIVQNAETYSPELTQEENPYYYNKNKLLYELHNERLRRSLQ